MNILIIGSGGREQALYQKAQSSKYFSTVFQIPFNSTFDNSYDVNISSNQEMINFVKSNNIDFTIVGGEYTLVNGIVDDFLKEGLKIFGPTKLASKLETSKSYAKKIMLDANVRTANYEVFDNYDIAINYLENCTYPKVIKYDGLADGKGVYIVENLSQATSIIEDVLVLKRHGNSNIIIEEFLSGEELSAFYIIKDNKVMATLPIAQDYKKIGDGNTGNNTGGMGAITTSKFDDLQPKITDEIINPVLESMSKDNNLFTGILYAGLIVEETTISVIEFNVRFGDPECEIIVEKLSQNIVDMIYDVYENKQISCTFDSKEYVCVVLACKGYPNKYEKSREIKGLENVKKFYHMNTKVLKNSTYTNGGRVLCVIGSAETIECAIEEVYENVNKISFSNIYYRSDIGKISNSK